MRKPEQRLWDRMRGALSCDFHLERVENVVLAGRPDVDVMYVGVTLPIELKVAKYPRRASTPVLGSDGLNQNQLNWWLRWRRDDGRGFILIGIEKDLYLVPGIQSDEVNNYTRAQLAPYLTDWNKIAETIRMETVVICLLNR